MPTEVNHYKYLKIRELATQDRPREKLITQGAAYLSNAELLAILIGSGIQNMTSIDLAKHLLKTHNNSLIALSKRTIEELTKYKGIGKAKATIIISAIELSKRMEQTSPTLQPKIEDPLTAYQLIKPYLAHKLTEECWITLLNRNSKLIKNHQISIGGLTKTTIDPKIIFKVALEYQAHGIVLSHNHPSGNPNPSQADLELTQNLLKGAKYLGIKILDHLILTENSYFSFANHNLI